ncbi:MAG: hypothetical protein JNL84_09205 [Candidatus Accumulibacter sp.]|nr:hypothetical protein [Accumulibacter sp.]
MAIGVITALLVYVWRWHSAALHPISPEDVARARTEGNIAFLILLLSLLVQ